MDPQKLIYLDRKVVKSERTISLFFTLGLAVILFLIERGTIVTLNFSYPAYYVGMVGFISLGLIQYFWNPYTHAKVLVYDLLFAVIGGLVSVFIIGFFSPLVYIGWMMLIITGAIYLSRRITFILYGIFILSNVAWIILNFQVLSMSEAILSLSAAIFAGLIAAYVMEIWGLFNKSVRQLDSSRANEKLVSERLASLINSMADAVLAVDVNGKIIEYNAALLDLLDLNLNLRDKDIAEIGNFIDQNNQKIDIKDVVLTTSHQKISRDYRIVYKDNSKANLYISIAPVQLGYGKSFTKGFVLVLRDITREKSLEEERDEFVSVISHELRTPIAIAEGEVSNAALFAEKCSAKPDIAAAIENAHKQIMFLSDMVNDLATLSRAERGDLEVDVENIDVKEFISELSSHYAPSAKKKGLALETSVEESLNGLNSSRLYVKEILQNFITNSIKYTETGSVKIVAKKASGGAIFEVSDTGIGISKSDKEKVFDKFFRSEDYRTRASSGSGLGLYVTMKLARLIHAKIEVRSELDKGSTFIITVPNL